MLKRKLEFLPTSFAVILSAMALPIILKVEFNFEVILYITISVREVWEAALNPQSVFKTHLKAHRLSSFRGS